MGTNQNINANAEAARESARRSDGKFGTQECDENPDGMKALSLHGVVTYEMNDSFPVPQANDLDKVAAAVIAISRGADSHEAVGLALEVDERQGAYYADAAGYLGLAEVVHGVTPKQYALTGVGEELVSLDDAGLDVGRTDLLKRVVASAPTVQAIVEDDEASARFLIEMDDLADATVDRRMATARSWAIQLGSDDLASAVTTTSAAARTRAVDAAKVAAEARRRVREAQAEKPVVICQKCQMQLPASGLCDDCD